MNSLDFSLIICNFNYAGFVSEAIESCLAQDYPPEAFEIIVVDDGSTDDSKAVLEKYKHNERIKVLFQNNLGHGAALELALAHSVGKYICLLDADDYFFPQKLSSVSQKVNRYHNLNDEIFLCNDCRLISDKQNIPKTWFSSVCIHSVDALALNLAATHFPFAVTSGQVYSRKLLQKIMNCLVPSDWKNHLDTVLGHLALLESGFVYYIHEELSAYRIHSTNEFAGFKDTGEFNPQRAWKNFWPKLLRVLESYIDIQEITFEERNERIAYLKRLESQLKISSYSCKSPAPLVSFIVCDDAAQPVFGEQKATILAQIYGNYEIVQASSSSSRLSLLAEAYFRVKGDYLVFTGENTVYDKYFLERHIYNHQYKALCTVTSSDVRIVDRGKQLVFASLFRESIWKNNLDYITPLHTHLNPYLPAMLGASCLRKTKLLDLFFEYIQAQNLKEFDEVYDWLILNFAIIFGGHLKFSECLGSVVVDKVDGLQFSEALDNFLILRKPNRNQVSVFFRRFIESNFRTLTAQCNNLGINLLNDWCKKNLA